MVPTIVFGQAAARAFPVDERGGRMDFPDIVVDRRVWMRPVYGRRLKTCAMFQALTNVLASAREIGVRRSKWKAARCAERGCFRTCHGGLN